MTKCDTCGAPVWKSPFSEDVHFSRKLTERKNKQTGFSQEELEWLAKLLDQDNVRVIKHERSFESPQSGGVTIRLFVECETGKQERL